MNILFIDNRYKCFEDYINSISNKFNFIKTYDINKMLELNLNNKYYFLCTLPKEIINKINENVNINNVYLINTEQMSRDDFRNKILSYPKNIKIIDYSYGNLLYLDKHFNNTQLIEYQYNPKEIYNFKKIYDVCFINGISRDRRKIIRNIQKIGIKVNIIKGWGEERDLKLFKHKILLNISYNKNYRIFESIRCLRCLYNNMIVVSNKKEDMEHLSYKDKIVFCDTDKIPLKIKELLENYEEL